MATATTSFTGFEPAAIQFLADLAANNDRAWFQPRKADYERLLKEPLERLVIEVGHRFEARGLPLEADPKRSLFRIYRDTRFSKDKSPYKTQVSASFRWIGEGSKGSGRSHSENVHASGGYFQLQPGNIFLGGGAWRPDSTWLKAFRHRVADQTDEFLAIVEAPEFVKAFGSIGDDGDSLQRVPPGYPADHPAADLLRKRNVTFGRRLADEDAFSAELPSILADAFETGTPLLRYLASI